MSLCQCPSPFTFANCTFVLWTILTVQLAQKALSIKKHIYLQDNSPQNATATKSLHHQVNDPEKKERSYESHHMWSLFLESVSSQTRKLATKYNYWLMKVVINCWNYRQLHDAANQYTQKNRDKKISMTGSRRAQTSPGLSRCGCVKGLGCPKYRFGIFFCWAGWMENLRRAHDLQTRGKETHHDKVKKPQTFQLGNCGTVVYSSDF